MPRFINDHRRLIIMVFLWIGGLLILAVTIGICLYAVHNKMDRYESEIMTETGIVKALSYRPSDSQTGVAPIIGGNGGMAITSSYTPEEYSVSFKCQKHGEVFSVSSKKLFGKLEVGQKVKIKYREIRRKSSDELIDIDFIGTDEGDQ